MNYRLRAKMAINPEHLIEQAEALSQTLSRRPRETDLRRAISNAYYAMFHSLAKEVADELVGVTRRRAKEYNIVYRSLEHGRAKDLCRDLTKTTLPQKYSGLAPAGGFCADITQFCTAFADLQERRHAADYDPSERFLVADAKLTLGTAKSAIQKLEGAPQAERRLFIHLLVFKIR